MDRTACFTSGTGGRRGGRGSTDLDIAPIAPPPPQPVQQPPPAAAPAAAPPTIIVSMPGNPAPPPAPAWTPAQAPPRHRQESSSSSEEKSREIELIVLNSNGGLSDFNAGNQPGSVGGNQDLPQGFIEKLRQLLNKRHDDSSSESTEYDEDYSSDVNYGGSNDYEDYQPPQELPQPLPSTAYGYPGTYQNSGPKPMNPVIPENVIRLIPIRLIGQGHGPLPLGSLNSPGLLGPIQSIGAAPSQSFGALSSQGLAGSSASNIQVIKIPASSGNSFALPGRAGPISSINSGASAVSSAISSSNLAGSAASGAANTLGNWPVAARPPPPPGWSRN